MPEPESIQVPYGWSPRPYQMPLWNALEGGAKRAMVMWHRRGGKDIVSVNWTARAAMLRVGTYWHMLPYYRQARRVIWDGITTIDGQPRKMRDFIPPQLVERERDDEMTRWLVNGSVWQAVGGDQIDSLVGTNPVGIVFSEFSLLDPIVWPRMQPILAENGGWALFIFTPRGRNHATRMFDAVAGRAGWFTQKLTVDDTHAISMEEIEEARRSGMSEELIQQEFWCSTEAPMEGSYYGKQIVAMDKEKRIGRVPWEPLRPVITGWDIGIGDDTAIWFAQQIGGEVRLIDYEYAAGQPIAYYAKLLHEKPYVYGEHLFPHDAAAREYGTGKSRQEMFSELGIRPRIIPNLRVEDGIAAVRALLPRVWIDEVKCKTGIQALREYRRQRDQTTGEYLDKPHKDWTNHPADALRMLAVGLRAPMQKRTVLAPRLPIA